MAVDKARLMETVGFMLGQEFADAAPKRSTRLAKSFTSTVRIVGDTIHYTLPYYAKSVMEGAAAHPITVRDKKVLAVPIKDWEGKKPNAYNSGQFPMLSKDGRFVLLGKKVNHPGNKPNPFMKDVMHRKLKAIIKKATIMSQE